MMTRKKMTNLVMVMVMMIPYNALLTSNFNTIIIHEYEEFESPSMLILKTFIFIFIALYNNVLVVLVFFPA